MSFSGKVLATTALAGAVVAGYAPPASAEGRCDQAVEVSCHIAHCTYYDCYLQSCVIYVAPYCVI